jgi:hypothetical protein
MSLVPEALSRDFAAAMIAREQGVRAVSVEEAICYVSRTLGLHDECRRRVRNSPRDPGSPRTRSWFRVVIAERRLRRA